MKRIVPYAMVLLITAATCGCRRAPSFNILGSFFPGWILCTVAAVVVTAGIHFALYRRRLTEGIRLLPLVYVSAAVFFACVFWLIFFE